MSDHAGREGTSDAARRQAAHALAELAQVLAAPPRSYALLGEGSLALRLDQRTFLVKASGMSLAGAVDKSFVRCDQQQVLALVQSTLEDNAEIVRALVAARADNSPALHPSLEAGLHAVLFAETEAICIAYSQPIPIAGLLCSARAQLLAAGTLFPEQVLVCGAHPLFLPYVEPGLPLARALQPALRAHRQRYGAPPKALYLQNNGFVAVGHSEAEALAITDMAVKAAEILALALAAGGPTFLPAEEARRIAGRHDEQYRQRALGLTEEEADHEPVSGSGSRS